MSPCVGICTSDRSVIGEELDNNFTEPDFG